VKSKVSFREITSEEALGIYFEEMARLYKISVSGYGAKEHLGPEPLKKLASLNPEELRSRMRKSFEGRKLFVLEVGGKIAGFASLSLHEGITGKRFWISHVAALPFVRKGKTLAMTRFVEHLRNYAHSQEASFEYGRPLRQEFSHKPKPKKPERKKTKIILV